jgi:hypothetical protein
VLLVVAFIASVVVSVIVYRNFVSTHDEPLIRIGHKETWGPFLRFERLAIDGILKALYLFFAVNAAFCWIAIVIASIFAGAAAFLVAVLGGGILLVLIEIVLRLGYETRMLLVIITKNTNDLSAGLLAHSSVEQGAFPAPDLSPSSVSQDSGTVTTQGARQDAASGWTCAKCGTTNIEAATFCRTCGTHRP